jgi:hypothetical protein
MSFYFRESKFLDCTDNQNDTCRDHSQLPLHFTGDNYKSLEQLLLHQIVIQSGVPTFEDTRGYSSDRIKQLTVSNENIK